VAYSGHRREFTYSGPQWSYRSLFSRRIKMKMMANKEVYREDSMKGIDTHISFY
jgi:hypothetical protein